MGTWPNSAFGVSTTPLLKFTYKITSKGDLIAKKIEKSDQETASINRNPTGWSSGMSAKASGFFMERWESKKHGSRGYSAVSYTEGLNNNLTDLQQPGHLHMQDNTSIHSAKKMKA